MRSPIRRRRCSGCTAKVVMCASSTISQSPAYPTMRPPSRATRYRAFLFCVSSWRNAFAGHGTGNDARSTSCTPSMSSRLMSSMTIGNVATIPLKLTHDRFGRPSARSSDGGEAKGCSNEPRIDGCRTYKGSISLIFTWVRVRIGEHVEGRDAHERGAVAPRDALPCRDRHTQTGERSRADRDGNAIDRGERRPGRKKRALDRREELVALPPLRVPRFLGED